MPCLLLCSRPHDHASDEFVELSLKLPKQAVIVFFGHDDSFSDNSKYLYLATVAANAGFQVLWCTRSRRLLAQLRQHDLPCFDLGQDQRRSINLLVGAAVPVFCENGHFWNDFVFGGCLAGAQKVTHYSSIIFDFLLLQPPIFTYDTRAVSNGHRSGPLAHSRYAVSLRIHTG